MFDSPALGRSIAGWNNNTFRMLDPGTGELKVVLDRSGMNSGERVNHFALSDDARVVAVHTTLNRVLWWDARSGRALAGLPSSGAIRMQLSPQGTYLAVVDDHARVTVFNLSRKEKTTLDRGASDHAIRGSSLSFSSDETRWQRL